MEWKKCQKRVSHESFSGDILESSEPNADHQWPACFDDVAAGTTTIKCHSTDKHRGATFCQNNILRRIPLTLSRVRVKVDWIYNRLSGVFLKLMTKTNCVSPYDPPCSPFIICLSWTSALKKYHMMRKNSGHFKIKNSQSELMTRAGKVHSQSRLENRWKFQLKSEILIQNWFTNINLILEV